MESPSRTQTELSLVLMTDVQLQRVDWYGLQTLGLSNSTLYWKNIGPRPVDQVTMLLQRNGSNDSLHIVVVDDTGDVTGIQGNILEKFCSLSKASTLRDGENPPRHSIKIGPGTIHQHLCWLQPINQRRHKLQHTIAAWFLYRPLL